MSVVPLFETALKGIPNATLAVAVSGGGDSIALLHMLAARGTGLRAVTVDHGLRDESAAEAQYVASICAALSVPHTILKWQDWDHSGNLQDAARRARLRLISQWARSQGISHIALGHTFDDQAETVLLRLARGSGVDGLSGMATSRVDGNLTWVRPLLDTRRDTLRTYLKDQNVTWIEDPSNDDPRFDRVKARRALALLSDLGITPEGLVATAERMRDARAVLERETLALAQICVEISDAGEVKITLPTFEAAPDELRHRLLSAVLMWVSGEPYKPRAHSLARVMDSTQNGVTLHGCILRYDAHFLTIRREPARVEGPRPFGGGQWDHRWEITHKGDVPEGIEIAALGVEGLQLCKNWRASNHSREVLLTTPALWSNKQLIAAPLAGIVNGWEIRLKDGKKGFYDALITR